MFDDDHNCNSGEEYLFVSWAEKQLLNNSEIQCLEKVLILCKAFLILPHFTHNLTVLYWEFITQKNTTLCILYLLREQCFQNPNNSFGWIRFYIVISEKEPLNRIPQHTFQARRHNNLIFLAEWIKKKVHCSDLTISPRWQHHAGELIRVDRKMNVVKYEPATTFPRHCIPDLPAFDI